MSTNRKSELQAFHEFLGGMLQAGQTDMSPEECVAWWRQVQEEMDESVAAIRQGLADVEAAGGQPLEEAFKEIRQEIERRRET